MLKMPPGREAPRPRGLGQWIRPPVGARRACQVRPHSNSSSSEWKVGTVPRLAPSHSRTSWRNSCSSGSAPGPSRTSHPGPLGAVTRRPEAEAAACAFSAAGRACRGEQGKLVQLDHHLGVLKRPYRAFRTTGALVHVDRAAGDHEGGHPFAEPGSGQPTTTARAIRDGPRGPAPPRPPRCSRRPDDQVLQPASDVQPPWSSTTPRCRCGTPRGRGIRLRWSA